MIGWDPATSPPPPDLGSYTRALLVNQDRRYLFVTPCKQSQGKFFYLKKHLIFETSLPMLDHYVLTNWNLHMPYNFYKYLFFEFLFPQVEPNKFSSYFNKVTPYFSN